MAFRKMTAIHKAISCAFAGALVLLEFHSIQADRRASEVNHIKDQSALNARLQAILKENRDGIAGILKDNQTRFSTTLATLTDLKTQTFNNLINLTGGNSFPYVWPMIKETSDVSLVIGNSGRFTLTGVEVHLMHDAQEQYFQKVGTVPELASRLLPFNIVPNPKGGLPDTYTFELTAQNGNYLEEILFLPAAVKVEPKTEPPIQGRKWQAMVTLSKLTCKTISTCRYVPLHDRNLNHFKNWAN